MATIASLAFNNVFIGVLCAAIARWKRLPWVFWLLLGCAAGPVVLVILAVAPRARLGAPDAPLRPGQMWGWALLGGGVVATGGSLIGMGFSPGGGMPLVALSVVFVAGGYALLRRDADEGERALVSGAPAAARRSPPQSDLWLHVAVAVVVAAAYGWEAARVIAAFLHNPANSSILTGLTFDALVIALSVYLVRGKLFARPLLILIALAGVRGGWSMANSEWLWRPQDDAVRPLVLAKTAANTVMLLLLLVPTVRELVGRWRGGAAGAPDARSTA